MDLLATGNGSVLAGLTIEQTIALGRRAKIGRIRERNDLLEALGLVE